MRPALQLLHCFCGRGLLCIFSPHSLHLGLSGENCPQVAETGFVGWHWVHLETSLSRAALNPLQRCWGQGTLQHPRPWPRQLWGTPITVSQLPRRPESVTLRGTEGSSHHASSPGSLRSLPFFPTRQFSWQHFPTNPSLTTGYASREDHARHWQNINGQIKIHLKFLG